MKRHCNIALQLCAAHQHTHIHTRILTDTLRQCSLVEKKKPSQAEVPYLISRAFSCRVNVENVGDGVRQRHCSFLFEA